jgi:hypothetical protein
MITQVTSAWEAGSCEPPVRVCVDKVFLKASVAQALGSGHNYLAVATILAVSTARGAIVPKSSVGWGNDFFLVCVFLHF